MDVLGVHRGTAECWQWWHTIWNCCAALPQKGECGGLCLFLVFVKIKFLKKYSCNHLLFNLKFYFSIFFLEDC